MDAEEFLAHHGVKGMKWGVRKDRDGGSSSGGSAGPSKKDNKAAYKEAKKEYNALRGEANKKVFSRSKEEMRARDQKHVASLMEEATMPNSKVLIRMTPPADPFSGRPSYPVVMTGPEFVVAVGNRGNRVDAVTTQVWANEKGRYSNEDHRHALEREDIPKLDSALEKMRTAKSTWKGK